jgi:hypothetical protein
MWYNLARVRNIFYSLFVYFSSFEVWTNWSVKHYAKPSSVADPGCLSRIPNPDIYPSRIPDLGSRIPDPGSKNSNKERGENFFFCHTFLYSHKFHKIENYFSFEVLKKKIRANFQRIIELLPKKLSQSSQKYGFGIRDPGFGIRIRDPEITYSGSRIQGSKRYRIPDPDPQHCLKPRKLTHLCLRQLGHAKLPVLRIFINFAAFVNAVCSSIQ